MSDYKETSITGTAYVRADKVVIDNSLDSKSITFNEVTVLNLSNGETRQEPFGSVSEQFSSANTLDVIPLINPETGLDTGKTMAYQDLYVAIYSLYFKLATERDAFEAEQLAAAEAAASAPAP